MRHSDREKSAFSPLRKPAKEPLPAKSLVAIFSCECGAEGRSAQLAQLTTN